MDILTETNSQPALANKGHRYLASVIDYALLILLYVFLGMFFGEQYTEGDTVGIRVEGWPAFVGMVFWFLLFPVAESIGGQTIGKSLMKIRVVRLDYSKASFGNTLARHLFDMIDYFPFFGLVGLLVANNNSLKQRVGDLIAKTVVVYK